MSKDSEISKHLDPDFNRDESTGIDPNTVENGSNGVDSGAEEQEGSLKPEEENQVSEGIDTTSNDAGVPEISADIKPQDEQETNTPTEDQNLPASTEVEETPEPSKDKIQVQQEQVQQPKAESDDIPDDQKVDESSDLELETPETVHPIGDTSQSDDISQSTESDSSSQSAESDERDLDSSSSETDKPPEKEKPAKPWDGVDFSTLDKAGLVKLVELLVKEDDPILAEKISRNLKSAYDVIHKADRQQALDRFVADDNDPDHFAFKFDELDNRFDGTFKLLRDKKFQYIKNLERNKEKNYAEKVRLLEELRALVDEEETTSSIQAVKKIQEEWRGLGPVPGQHVKTLWANYHALMDLYYDQRSIYFELKELDRKKNLEAKLELCEKAEKLVSVQNLKVAIAELNELHEEFKHIGPVPKADQQALWDRFKHASDQVYARRKEYIKHLKEDLKENLKKKVDLSDDVQQYLEFNSDRITDWNKKTKSILVLQKQWESIGGLPRENAKEVNKRFWGAFKGFFHNKGLFFKKLEGERVANLEKKKELVTQAEELRNSTNWNETAEQLKKLQKHWRDIGPVPEKFRNSVYQQFKEACDAFFSNRRSQNQELEQDYVENLKKKQRICTEIETMITAGDHDLDKFLDLKQKFIEIGYVPAGEVKNIRAQFTKTSNDFLANVPEELSDEARQIKYDIQFEKLKKGPHADRRKEQKEQTLRREINTLENDISTWNNNMEFFANSKTANKVKEEFTVKIEQAGKKLQELKSQLRALRQL